VHTSTTPKPTTPCTTSTKPHTPVNPGTTKTLTIVTTTCPGKLISTTLTHDPRPNMLTMAQSPPLPTPRDPRPGLFLSLEQAPSPSPRPPSAPCVMRSP
jgi:hypothetical protein